MSETDFGLLISTFLWVYALANPLGGYLADRFGRSRVIIGSMIAWSLVTWLTAYGRTVAELVALRGALGIAQACYLPAAGALITDYHRGATRSLATGIYMSGVVFGAAVSGLGGWLAQWRSWSFPFIVVGAAGVAFSVLVLPFVLRDLPRGRGPGAAGAPVAGLGEALISLGTNGPFLLTFLYWGLLGAVTWVVASWMPSYLQEHFHLGQGAAGFSANGYFFMAELAGLLAGGAWADRWSRTNRRGRIYVPVIGLCVSAPCFWLAAHSGHLAVTLGGLVVWGLGAGFASANMMPILCLIVDARFRATGFGLLNAASAVAGGIGIYGAGALRDLKIDLRQYGSLASVSIVVCIALLLFLRPRYENNGG